tara:strand:- start:42 stop:944 length:903 start_codon:yes stop_codon:yes gene_type:complete
MMDLFWGKQAANKKFDIDSFRNTKKHNIFANWSPYDRGLLYHNFFINYFVNQNRANFIKFKKRLNNLNIGNPPCIFYDNKFYITYDDCLSFEENMFLKKNFKKKEKLNIVEIGPGYGRSVEHIIKNYNIKQYVVIDYKNILSLTKKYLKKVLKNKDYKKIIFCDFENFKFKKEFFLNKYKILNFDLLLNSDSFHEIETYLVKKYINYFSPICNNFFIKNAVAKYRVKDLVNHLSKKKVPKFNIKLGLIADVINIFCTNQIKHQSKKYLKKYNPYKDKMKASTELSKVFPTTLMVLFKKNN